MALQRALSQRRHAFYHLISTHLTPKAAPLLYLQRFYSGSSYPGSFSGSPMERDDEYEKRLFSDFGNDAKSSDSFYRKLDTIKRHHGPTNPPPGNNTASTGFSEGIFDDFNSLEDGMHEKLDSAARTFQYSEEIYHDDYKFRPDVTFRPGQTYTRQDLDLTKPGVQKSFKRTEFETTTKEVLKKADFRNVRFLANFLTEAGIIIKRSQTRISAKAQRKVAREIKTARAFGLMPFTTMGKKPFAFGASNKNEDEDYVFEDNPVGTPAGPF